MIVGMLCVLAGCGPSSPTYRHYFAGNGKYSCRCACRCGGCGITADRRGSAAHRWILAPTLPQLQKTTCTAKQFLAVA
jgi:hypothetical protein